MEWSGDDALGIDGDESGMIGMEGMAIAWLTVARGAEEIVVRDDADGTWMNGRCILATEQRVDERPVAIEEGPLDVAVDEMLQHGEDVREGGGLP